MVFCWENKLRKNIYDVIVIGSGFAGLSAAIEAAEKGAEVLVVEKMKAFGGNSIISDGGIAAPCTKLQEKFGIIDSVNSMYEDMMKSGLNLNNTKLVRTLVDNAKDSFDWSINHLGIEYIDRVDIFGGHSVPRCYAAKNVTGATIIKKQIEKLEALKVEMVKETYLETVIFEEGEVKGVEVKEGYDYRNLSVGESIYLEARKGVILAAGGFGSDKEFRKKYDNRLDDKIDSTNKPFATSEVIREAVRIGAELVDMEYIQLGPWASPDEKGYGEGPMFSEYIVFQHGIIVDPNTGKRFINELVDRKTLSDELLSIGHPCIGIADERAVYESGWDISKAIDRNVVIKFDSIKKLSDYYNIKFENLLNTIEAFNKSIDQGIEDEYGKTLLSQCKKIEKSPYYAIRLWPKVHFTMGGLKINENAQVINVNNKPINKLYAAGEITGGVHGASRLGSCSITDCFVFGRIAGRNIMN